MHRNRGRPQTPAPPWKTRTLVSLPDASPEDSGASPEPDPAPPVGDDEQDDGYEDGENDQGHDPSVPRSAQNHVGTRPSCNQAGDRRDARRARRHDGGDRLQDRRPCRAEDFVSEKKKDKVTGRVGPALEREGNTPPRRLPPPAISPGRS